MANKFQKFLFNFSALSPLCFIFSFLWYFQKKTLTVPISCGILGIILIFIFLISFTYAKKQVEIITIRVVSVTPKDSWMIAYIITYALPFAGLATDDFDIVILIIISAILILVLPFLNSVVPNPLLFLQKYHFYEISTENGVSGYLLLSQRNLCNAKQVTMVNQLFDYICIDLEEKDV